MALARQRLVCPGAGTVLPTGRTPFPICSACFSREGPIFSEKGAGLRRLPDRLSEEKHQGGVLAADLGRAGHGSGRDPARQGSCRQLCAPSSQQEDKL